MDKPIVGISCGDLNGIGLEILMDIFSDPAMLDHCIPVIFCSAKVINFYKKHYDAHNFNYTNIKNIAQLNTKRVNIYNCWEEEVALQPGHLTEEGGKYAIISLQTATQALQNGEIDVIVTAPIHKKNTQLTDFPFVGHTPYFKSFFNAQEILMILYEDNFRVTLMSEHVPIIEAAQQLTPESLYNKLKLIAHTLKRDFNIQYPRIAVLGLNPHAGDDGVIGREEKEIIIPGILRFNEQEQAQVFGPYSADAFFARRNDQYFDMILAMYHDQGLIPFKSLSTGYGTNYTAGLPFIRTSPDHGVAFDNVGKGAASVSSFRRAIFEAIDLFQNRLMFDQQEIAARKKENI